VKLRRYLLRGCVAACYHTTASSLMLVEGRNMWERYWCIF